MIDQFPHEQHICLKKSSIGNRHPLFTDDPYDLQRFPGFDLHFRRGLAGLVGPDDLSIILNVKASRTEGLPEFSVFTVYRFINDFAAFNFDQVVARQGHQTCPLRPSPPTGEMEFRLSTIAIGSRGGDHRRQGWGREPCNPAKGLRHLPVLEFQLMGVGDMLHSTAAAAGVIRTERRHTVMRWDDDPDKPSSGIALPDLGDFDLYLVSIDGEGNKDHQILILPNAVAAESHIPDFRFDVLADLQTRTLKMTTS